MERRGLLEVPKAEQHYRNLIVEKVYAAMKLMERSGGNVGSSQAQEGGG